MDWIKTKIGEYTSKVDFGSFHLKLPNFDLHSSFFRLIYLIAAIFILASAIDYLLSRSFLGKKYRIFVAPGVILHEVSHAFFCMMTGAKIKAIALFDETGGHVDHERSKVPVIGQILISVAPFIFGPLAIYLLSKLIGLESVSINSTKISIGLFSQVFADFSKMNFHSVWTWIILYLVLSISVTMTPSRKDFENIAMSVVTIILISFAAYQFISYKVPNIAVPEKLIVLLSTTALLLILSLGFSIVVYGLSKLIHRNG